MQVRYISDFQAVKTLAEAHKALFSSAAVTITDEAGVDFAGCNLVPNGYVELRRTTCAGPLTRILGEGNGTFLEAQFTFQQDAP